MKQSRRQKAAYQGWIDIFYEVPMRDERNFAVRRWLTKDDYIGI